MIERIVQIKRILTTLKVDPHNGVDTDNYISLLRKKR